MSSILSISVGFQQAKHDETYFQAFAHAVPTHPHQMLTFPQGLL